MGYNDSVNEPRSVCGLGGLLFTTAGVTAESIG
jgi:hypothetical protein